MMMLIIHLEEPVQRYPEQKDISKELHQMKHAVDNPVSQPFRVIILLLRLNCLDATRQTVIVHIIQTTKNKAHLVIHYCSYWENS